VKFKIFNFIILTLLLISTFSLNGFSFQKAENKNKPKTIKDYFLIIPMKYLNYGNKTRKQQLEYAEVDETNGYLYFQDGAEDRTQITLFKKQNGNYIIAISYLGEGEVDKNNDLHSESELYLLEYNGNWSDVTKKYLPVKFDKHLIYDLPKEGKTIKVSDENNKFLYGIEWDKGNSKFIYVSINLNE
jgi:hypothetical protein